MDYRDIQLIWDEQNAKALYGFDQEAFEAEVIAKNESLRRRFSFCELTLASIFGCTGILMVSEPLLENKDHFQYFTGSLYLFVSIAIGIHWNRRRSLPQFDRSLVNIVEGMIEQIESHIRFLNWSWLWLGLPYALVVGIAFTIQGDGKPPWLWLVLLLGLPLSMWMTLRDIPRIHRPKIAELESLRRTLSEGNDIEIP